MSKNQLGIDDVVVLGGGIVGLACAWAARREGLRVTLIDRDFEGDRASHGNAGGIGVTECTPITLPAPLRLARMMLDPLGPVRLRVAHLPKSLPWFWELLRASQPHRVLASSRALASLTMRVYEDLLPMLDDIGATPWLYRRGALVVYETERSFQAALPEWRLRQDLGVTVEELNGEAIRRMEPALAPLFPRGLFLPQWSHVADPKRIVEALRHRVAALGVTLVQSDVQSVETSGPRAASVTLLNQRVIPARRVVVALGAWSARIANGLGDPVLLESERGYNTTVDAPHVSLTREIIFSDRSFVATPLDIGIRIGGGAEFAGLDAMPNYRRCDALLTLGQRFLPTLGNAGAKQWMGHRPATPDGLPVIGPSPKADAVIYAFGHGHVGLTLAATTGVLVAEMLREKPPSVPLDPFSILRFSGANANKETHKVAQVVGED